VKPVRVEPGTIVLLNYWAAVLRLLELEVAEVTEAYIIVEPFLT